MQVFARGADMTVAQQLLDREEIDTALKQMGGETMAPIPMSA